MPSAPSVGTPVQRVARWAATERGQTVLRRGMLVLFLGLGLIAAVQRGLLTPRHATFPIFRQSFPHLVAGEDLYATYPHEQGIEDRDRFKYNPSAAVLLSPLSLLPFTAGIAAWTILNALAVYAAVRRLFPGRAGIAALAIVFPALIAAVQSTSSNGLIAALVAGAFVGLESRQWWRASGAVVTATVMKLYPAALLPLMLIRRESRRGALWVVAAVGAIILAAPLLVTPPAFLVDQYRSWLTILRADAGDLVFARSIMVVFRQVTGVQASNVVFQGIATTVLLAPLALRPGSWEVAAFRRDFLASLLVFFVVFNHQAENASYVIAAVGLAIWFLSRPATPARWVLLVACMAGLEAVPYFLVWLFMQFDLLDGQKLVGGLTGRASRRVDSVPRGALSAADPA